MASFLKRTANASFVPRLLSIGPSMSANVSISRLIPADLLEGMSDASKAVLTPVVNKTTTELSDEPSAVDDALNDLNDQVEGLHTDA
jgi:hypothetical protein